MSRIILKKYDNGEPQIVVGWDRPCASFFWQEFNKEPEPDQSGEVDWTNWEEKRRYAGYRTSELPTMSDFMASVPNDIDALVTKRVQQLLNEHSMDPDAGRIVVDLSEEPEYKS